MMQSHLFCAALALLCALCLLLTGCGAAGAPEEQDGKPVELTGTITELQCLQTVPSFFMDAGNGRILVISQTSNEATGTVSTTLSLVDVAKDAVTATAGFDAPLEPVMNAAGLWLRDCYAECLYRLKDDLAVAKTLRPDSSLGTFSADGKEFYYVASSLLFAMNAETEAVRRIPLEKDLRLSFLTGVDTATGQVIANAMTADVEKEATVIFDPADGKVKLLRQGLNIDTQNAGRYVGATYNFDSEKFEYYFGDADSLSIRYFGEDSNAFRLAVLKGSQYLYTDTEKASGAGDGDSTVTTEDPRILRIHGDAVEYALLADKMEHGISNVTYLPRSGWIVGGVNDGKNSTVAVIDPQKLDYTGKLETREDKLPSLIDTAAWDATVAADSTPALRAGLEKERAEADAIEKEFGVSVLISGQCDIYNDNNDFAAYHVESTDAKLNVEYEREIIHKALTELHRALSLYPDGFFRQFRLAEGVGGVRYLLTGNIDNASGDFDVGGYAEIYREWYVATVDIMQSSYYPAFHHETWHLMEQFINTKDSETFGDANWSPLNPSDYHYNPDDFISSNDHGYTAFSFHPNEAYFVDVYGMSNAMEDRARVFEAAMSPENYQSSAIFAHPKLKAKLDFLSKAIRSAYDTTGWGDPAWEKWL